MAALVAEARAAIESAETTDELRQVAASVSGKKSALAEASRALGSMDPDARKELGRQLHEARTTVEELLEVARAPNSATPNWPPTWPPPGST